MGDTYYFKAMLPTDLIYFVQPYCTHVWANCYLGPAGASPAVIITECSVPNVTFSLTQTLNINSVYSFLAACMSNGSCVSANMN